MSKLTTEQQINAKSWLSDLFCSAKIGPSFRPEDYQGLTLKLVESDSAIKDCILKILSVITRRQFVDINDYLDYISKVPFGVSRKDSVNLVKATPQTLALFLAWYCSECAKPKVVWNNSLASKDEEKYFLDTYLGKALLEYDCFINPIKKEESDETDDGVKTIDAAKSGLSTEKVSIDSTITAVKPTGSGGPKDPYKSEGPMSDRARDLISKPHEKVKPFSHKTCMYAVVGKSTTSKAPVFAFIRPLSVKGRTIVGGHETNFVFIGRDSAYRDCACWFETPAEADAFLVKCWETKLPSTVLDLRVYGKRADSNGYFKIGTEFGACYIKASKLNEELEENLEESAQLTEAEMDELINKQYPMTNTITDIDYFVKNYNHYDK